MKIGFLGLGNMGEPIAANLISAGHQVTVWNRTASKADPLEKKGRSARRVWPRRQTTKSFHHGRR